MELTSALLFYLIFSLFVFIGLPLTVRLTINFVLAWSIAKLTGLILFAYTVWIFSYFHILDYQNYFVIISLFVITLLLSILFFIKRYNIFNKDNRFREIIWVEIISLVIYLLYLLIRSRNPSINGTEHFMDMALLSATGKTNYFPFIDSWYAGKLVNYYYYGHYLVSLIANISRVSYELAYNFALGLIFTQSAILSGLLVYATTRLKKYAFLTAFLVTISGTLFFSGCVLNGLFSEPSHTCSYPSSTRLYTPSYIINEIPSYSFTVGNLHAHLIDLPIFILCLVLLSFITLSHKPKILHFIIFSFVLATITMTNLWDMVTVTSVFCAIIILKIIKLYFNKTDWDKMIPLAGEWLKYGVGSLILVFLLTFPYSYHFSSPVLGLAYAPGFVRLHNLTNVQYPTPLLAVVGMWGLFLISGLVALYYMKKDFFNDSFSVSLLLISVGIIVGTEIFFVADIYSVANPPFFRANTTFKFGYTAWVMLSIIFSIFLANINKSSLIKKHQLRNIITVIIAFLAITAGIMYHFEAIRQYYPENSSATLNGSRWMNISNPDDWATIQFINKNIKSRSIIAEAVGDSYSYYARISSFTGMITPMGWKSHEWTWRFDKEAAKKAIPGVTIETGYGPTALVASDIERLYNTSDILEAQKIINKYDIQFIYVGNLERTTYSNLKDEKFHNLGSIIFESGNSKLYKIN